MSSANELFRTFDKEASKYEKMRPEYVKELYGDIFSYHSVGETSSVIEIGIGGGQATLPFLKTGCKLTAVEYGANLSELCREKYKDYPRFSVVNSKFEDFQCPDNSVDVIFSASAFHWIPEEIGYPKVFNMLKSGGIFARFANHPFLDKGRPEMSEGIQEIYKKYRPDSYSRPIEYTEENAKQRADIAEKYGFCDMAYNLYKRTRTFSSDDYILLLGTYSDNISLEDNIRRSFFSEIKAVIDSYGGFITLYDTIDLQLARKQ